MARKGGWSRKGSKNRFRYLDARENEITDEAKLARIDGLRIPPAWRDVWISPRPGAQGARISKWPTILTGRTRGAASRIFPGAYSLGEGTYAARERERM